jgi:tetratricopeptide (TPR) repeat protein
MTGIAGLCLLVLLGVCEPCIAQATQASNSKQAAPPSAEIQKIEKSLREGRFQDAQDEAQELVTKQSGNALGWTYLGMARSRLQQVPQAVQAFETAISLAPQNPRPYLELATLYASTNQLDKSLASYQKGLALDDHNASAYRNYGRLLMVKGRLAEAREALKHSLELNPKDTQAQNALVETLLRSHQREEAQSQVHNLLQSEATPAPVLVSLGVLLVRAGEFGEAQSVLKQALLRDPKLLAIHLAFSRLYTALGDHPQAISSAREAVTLDPSSLEAHLSLADALINARDHSQALDQLLKVQLQFQDSAAFQYTLGIAQFGVHRYPQGIACFKKAVRRDPRSDLPHFLLGSAFLATGNLEEAEKSLKTAVALNPNQVLYYNYLARVYEQKGEAFKDAALEVTKEVLALDPKDAEARERLAKWAKDEGNLPRARSLLEEIVHDSPSDISARLLLASVYYQLNLRNEGDKQQQAAQALEAEAQKQQRHPQEQTR